MSLEKALEIKHEFNLESIFPIILTAFEYQNVYKINYQTALEYVRLEYLNKNDYK